MHAAASMRCLYGWTALGLAGMCRIRGGFGCHVRFVRDAEIRSEAIIIELMV
jgi:hypothetical protein